MECSSKTLGRKTLLHLLGDRDRMPQSERSQIIIELLKWIRDVKTATRSQIINYIRLEATALGSSSRTAVKYFEDLGHFHLIELIPRSTARWRITSDGESWLARHSQ